MKKDYFWAFWCSKKHLYSFFEQNDASPHTALQEFGFFGIAAKEIYFI